MWNVIFRYACASVICLAAGAGPAMPDGLGREAGVLRHSGQAVELRGLRARVIAFYEGQGEQVALTVLLSGGSLGGEVLRSRVALRDGQRHTLITGGGDSETRERFSFTRSGSDVRVAFEPVPAESPERVGAAPEDAGTRVATLSD